MISYVLYRSASALLRVVPDRVSSPLAVTIAFCFYVARPRVRRNVRRNMERLGSDGLAHTWPVFRNFSLAVRDLLRLPHLKPDDLAARCSLKGVEHLERALARGKGAILFAPHLGPWEIAGASLASKGFRIRTVALEHPSSRVTKYFSSLRATWSVVDYPSQACSGVFLQALQAGEPIVLLVDRNFSQRGLRLPFFGEETLVPRGHVILALRTGAALLPCCSYYKGNGRIEGIIGPPVDVGESPLSAQTIAASCLERIEEFIRAHPDQWFAFDHVWREPPHV